MKTNERQTSAKKKLIPAVAMLTASAVMLTTATYAWFTMNKNAKVDGLEMAATAGGGLEISLGQIGDGNLNGKITTPAMDDTSWKKIVHVGEYYNEIAKIKPASTVDGNKLYYASDEDITAGGKVVQDSATVSKTTDNDVVTLKVRDSYDASGDTTTVTEANNTTIKDGRYVDIPMWIRTTNKEAKNIKCEVTIGDGKTVDDTSATELQKAVRVAIIPLETANVKANGGTNNLDITNANEYTRTVSDAINVFGLNFDSYHTGTTDSKPQGINNTKVASTEYSTVLGDILDTRTTITTDTDDHTDATAVFNLAAATANNYSVESFVVRVWLEGESVYCNDANADQDWNISLDFTVE